MGTFDGQVSCEWVSDTRVRLVDMRTNSSGGGHLSRPTRDPRSLPTTGPTTGTGTGTGGTGKSSTTIRARTVRCNNTYTKVLLRSYTCTVRVPLRQASGVATDATGISHGGWHASATRHAAASCCNGSVGCEGC